MRGGGGDDGDALVALVASARRGASTRGSVLREALSRAEAASTRLRERSRALARARDDVADASRALDVARAPPPAPREVVADVVVADVVLAEDAFRALERGGDARTEEARRARIARAWGERGAAIVLAGDGDGDGDGAGDGADADADAARGTRARALVALAKDVFAQERKLARARERARGVGAGPFDVAWRETATAVD
jgi:hypothetical protein